MKTQGTPLAWSTGEVVGLACAAVAVATLGFFVHKLRQSPVKNSFYVALGSSFAAGLGLGERAPGSPIVSQRSVNGYPQQLARFVQVPSFTDMTSSGSTVEHVLRGGQFGMPPQVDALGPDTRLVTLTAGGNDIGYVGDLLWMAFGNQRSFVGAVVRSLNRKPKTLEARGFDTLKTNLVSTLEEIKRRSPQARVVVVTYPAVLPAQGTCATLSLSEGQAELTRSVASRLTEVTRDAAREAGVTVVDMASMSGGHDACSPTPWVNGFRPEQGTSFHPTRAGAEATALAIKNTIKNSWKNGL